MRKLFVALLLLLASIAAALWLRDHQGFVIIKVGAWSVQTSLVLFAGILLVGWAVLGLVWTLLARLFATPRGMRRWVQGRRRNRSRERLVNGLIQLAEGHYEQAERMLTRQAEADGLGLFHYLLAAISAHRRGDNESRDRFLSLADESESGAEVAVGLVQARFQLDARQREQALATLSWLHERAPGNRQVLALLYRCVTELEDWERARELLPQLRRHQALPADELDALETRLATERLDDAVAPGAEQSLASIWQGLTRAERRDPALRAHYARCLIRSGESAAAAELLKGWLRHDWDDRLVTAWGELEEVPGDQGFAQAERWLNHRPDDPVLLRTAGLQALRGGLWGRARSCLEAAAARDDDALTHRLLGDLYQQLGEPELARRAWHRAMDAGLGRPAVTVPALPPRQAADGSDVAEEAGASSSA
ncbi:heme biosynthesis HemY N-terminal domain-containing protein [Arhodomonas aquaeolei]|uniref:heme biosynthesis HemY N-terminal domain-containing protein n=1 Tax=Arhodomonas aquaeolei TaxID=2369 RepID=UPI00036946DB|nr:heme biosynthesis HemY N-terminal domain-containing protein [Arhodomonas aquaeolei]